MRGYACIGLDNPKNPANVGSAMRAVGVYGAAMLAVTGNRFNLKTDTQKSFRHAPLLFCDDLRDVIPYDCVPVTVDIIDGAVPLPI